MMRFLFVLCCCPLFLNSQVPVGTNSQAEPVFKIVEEMPQFLDCGPIKVLSRSTCFQDYICRNLTYPEFAKKNGVIGAVIISFVINKIGKVENAKIIQDIGAGCGTAALNFVNAMPDWISGKQRGISVKVRYKLTVDYRLLGSGCR